MRFTLKKSTFFNTEEDKVKYEELGFKFKLDDPNSVVPWILDSPMPTIEIKSLEDLLIFIDKYGEIVLTGDSIIIYDGYLE
jgi:hypothetical protein